MNDLELDERKILVLHSADDAGCVNFPCASAMEIEERFNSLLRLEVAGYVTRNAGKAFYRPFTLTPKGKVRRGTRERAKVPHLVDEGF